MLQLRRNLQNISPKWQSVVGLEIHAQISAKSKLFSGASTEFGLPVNTAVSFFDASTPGTLPVLNQKCVTSALKTALALNCSPSAVSMFDRKHYFYADMPNGYQITQQRKPIARDGHLDLLIFGPQTKKPYKKTVRLLQLQLEQDSGKSLHDEYEGQSLLDLNRAGVPLMELVFAPDLSDGVEAAALVKELVLILTRLGTCSCRMEEGALRVDANVSVNRLGEELGTRTEIKNIGSIRAVANAITYEIDRQIRVKESGAEIHNETRAWNSNTRETVSMRDKEVLQDYRFMPEPNLPPLHINTSEDRQEMMDDMINVRDMRESLPELPEESRRKLCEDRGLTLESAVILVNEPTLLSLFEQSLQLEPSLSCKTLANVLINDLISVLHKAKKDIEQSSVPSAEDVVALLQLLDSDVLNNHLLHLVLERMIEEPDKGPLEIISENNLRQITDPNQIETLCRQAIESNPKAVAQFKAGKRKALKALIGDVYRLSDEKANMRLAVEKLNELLKT